MTTRAPGAATTSELSPRIGVRTSLSLQQHLSGHDQTAQGSGQRNLRYCARSCTTLSRHDGTRIA